MISDISGLIGCAHEKRGSWLRFVKHIERCSFPLFAIDMAGTDDHLLAEHDIVLPSEVKCQYEHEL
jgi:GTPase involved in cell partitioning and DNA repair